MTSADTGRTNKHVVVIGAGSIGSCCAWKLRKSGFEVTLIDPEMPGQSTSYGNAGCLSTSHVTPFAYPGVTREIPGWLFDPAGPLFIRWSDFPGLIPWFWKFWRSGTKKRFDWSTTAQARLMSQAIDDYDEILSETHTENLRRKRGAISVYDSRQGFDKEIWKYELKESMGLDWQILSQGELNIMVPELDIGDGVAVYNPDWQFLVDPARFASHVAETCFAQGGHWLQDKVASIKSSKQGISIRTESGQQIRSDTVVVAAGVWSNQIAQQLDYKLPLTAKRGYHSMIGEPGIELDYPVMSMARGFVMTPMTGGLRVAGTAEFAALDAEPDYRRAKVLLKQAQDYLPNLRCEDVSEWMGQRPMMADSIPVISRSPAHKNVFYAFGHGHYGLTQGPTTGKIITALVSGQEPEINTHDYRFERFRN